MFRNTHPHPAYTPGTAMVTRLSSGSDAAKCLRTNVGFCFNSILLNAKLIKLCIQVLQERLKPAQGPTFTIVCVILRSLHADTTAVVS